MRGKKSAENQQQNRIKFGLNIYRFDSMYGRLLQRKSEREKWKQKRKQLAFQINYQFGKWHFPHKYTRQHIMLVDFIDVATKKEEKKSSHNAGMVEMAQWKREREKKK